MSQFVYYFEPLKPQDISARALVLSMLSGTDVAPQPIGRFINGGALFGIEAATTRVAVTRLMKDGLLESPSRGIYRPGPRSQALTRRVQQWREVADRVVPWNADWLVALTHHLGRTDRKQLRARERALALTGYQEAMPGFWVRPANLSRSLEDHRADLTGIGADDAIALIRVAEVAIPDGADWPGLWSSGDLSKSYGRAIKAMTGSLERLDKLSPEDAARETLLIGQAVIRTINFDPLLPPELGNQKDFLRMVDTMREYNRVGRRCWAAYHAGMERQQAEGAAH